MQGIFVSLTSGVNDVMTVQEDTDVGEDGVGKFVQVKLVASHSIVIRLDSKSFAYFLSSAKDHVTVCLDMSVLMEFVERDAVVPTGSVLKVPYAIPKGMCVSSR